MRPHFRFLRLLCALSAVVLLPHAASADPLARSQIACFTFADAAGARVGNAVAETLLHCLRLAATCRLPAGQTADQCMAADRSGKVAHASARTAKVFLQKCRTQPPFGLTDPATVNSAFSQLVLVR